MKEEGYRNHLLDEVQAFACLKADGQRISTCLVNLHHVIQTDARLYFVLDYCPGGELFMLLKRKRNFFEKEILTIAAETWCVVDFVHNVFGRVIRLLFSLLLVLFVVLVKQTCFS